MMIGSALEPTQLHRGVNAMAPEVGSIVLSCPGLQLAKASTIGLSHCFLPSRILVQFVIQPGLANIFRLICLILFSLPPANPMPNAPNSIPRRKGINYKLFADNLLGQACRLRKFKTDRHALEHAVKYADTYHRRDVSFTL